jgi:iron(III) transport system substrate-binding protein
MMVNKKTLMVLIVLLFCVSSVTSVFAEEIVVYSARKKSLTKIPFNTFFRKTGINIKLVTGKTDELLERLKKEGEKSPADMLLTVDAGSLWKATQADLFQPIESDVLTKNIPAHLRDPQNYWFGLSKRARTIVYSSQRVSPSDLSTYEDLAQPKWQNRLCLRTSKKVYNQSLTAMMIEKHGVEKTEKIIDGWVQNLATEPYKKDTDVIRAIMDGHCDVGIVNHYYLGRMLKSKPDMPVELFWPNQGENEGGVYVDISGAGITKHAKNKELAVKLLNWLSSKNAQSLFAGSNMEYPVNPNVKPSFRVQSWGDFKQNTDNISQSGQNRDRAVELMTIAKYQ